MSRRSPSGAGPPTPASRATRRFARYSLSMRNPLRIPRVLEDTASAIRASLPHAQHPTSPMSEQERAAARRRIAELTGQARRENEAAERPYEELSARHPDWVDF
jgi:hypothetical protein